MEADITVCKQPDNQYLVIATDSMHRHVETLLKRGLDPQADKHVTVADVTGAYTQLNIQGPKSRLLMQALTDENMSNDAFPFRTAKEISKLAARHVVLCCIVLYCIVCASLFHLCLCGSYYCSNGDATRR